MTLKFYLITIVLIFLGGFIVQGAAEEILSRGWMMQVIGARYKPWLGVLISSLLFAILHWGNRGITPLPVINLIFFALFMALFVMKVKNLWSVCGLSVSGTGEKVTLFDLNTYGNTFISGGGFGPEGSIITTVVMLTGILLLSLIIINKAPIKRKEEENNYSDLLS